MVPPLTSYESQFSELSIQMLSNDDSENGITESPFLRLPSAVRERIYALAGLVRKCPVNIEEEHKRWSDIKKAYLDYFNKYRPYNGVPDTSESNLARWQDGKCAYEIPSRWELVLPIGAGCIHPRLPVQLLRVSKKIYLEAARMLYSQNRIVLTGNTFSLPKIALEFLTFLEVRLTACSCITLHQCDADLGPNMTYCPDCHYYCKTGNDFPLDIDERSTREELLPRWSTFCSHLRERLVSQPAEDFRFTLVCDCDNVKTARHFLQPLENFPTLQHATIRLGQSPKHSLRRLAEKTVQHLTGSKGRSATSTSFLELPVEIQELILTKTDLVAPLPLSWREIMTTPEHEDRELLTGLALPGFRLYHDKLDHCCQQCTLSGDVCACPTRHAAYTSQICKCWNFPKSLFRVNRSINQMATRIFFSQNQIVLWEARSSDDHGCGHYLLPSRQFFEQMPPHGMTHIRSLRLTFCTFDLRDYIEGSVDYDSWVELTTMIKSLPILEQLTVEIDYFHNIEWRWGMRDLSNPEAFKVYTNIVNLFKPPESRHYKNFFVRLGFWANSTAQDRYRWELERKLERSIMGEKYNAAAAGKYADKLRWNESLRPKFWTTIDQGLDWNDESLFVP